MRRIIQKHGVSYHKYADDIQLYVTFDPSIPGDRERAVERLTACIKELRQWMIAHWLKLNDGKTELVMFMSKHHLKKHGQCTISIGDSTISPAEHVRNLGVQMDRHLDMVSQVTATCASCNYQLIRLSSIRRYITMDAARTVVQALVTSRLDYCNSLLINIPVSQLDRLQRIQNNAARLVSRVPYTEQLHITPVLQALHWLPVIHRVTYKMLVTVFKCIHGMAPTYLSQLLVTRQRDSRLRQADALVMHQPLSKKRVGEQAFGVAGPRLWNTLPMGIRSAATLTAFKKALKTHLFKAYFD
jgi:hypothetical protein